LLSVPPTAPPPNAVRCTFVWLTLAPIAPVCTRSAKIVNGDSVITPFSIRAPAKTPLATVTACEPGFAAAGAPLSVNVPFGGAAGCPGVGPRVCASNERSCAGALMVGAIAKARAATASACPSACRFAGFSLDAAAADANTSAGSTVTNSSRVGTSVLRSTYVFVPARSVATGAGGGVRSAAITAKHAAASPPTTK